MWRYRDRVEISIGMGVDLSGDLCVQARGCLGACVCARGRQCRGGVGRCGGSGRVEGGRRRKREAMTSVRGRGIS